jgi:hypothetical protein
MSRLRNPYRPRLLSAWASDVLAAILMLVTFAFVWLLIGVVVP